MRRRPPVRVGIVGAGNIARAYAEVLERSRSAKVVAVADQVPQRAAALAARLGCLAFPSHEAMLAGTDVEAAIVCTPPASHATVSIALLESSVSVLCEKPFATRAEEAHRMVDAAAGADATIMMAAKFRYVDDVRRATRLVGQGLLGDIVALENSFTSRIDMRDRWNSVPTLSGGGVLIDNGTHSVDLVRCLVGPIDEVLAVEGNHVQGLGVEDTAHLFMRSTGGTLATSYLSWSVDKHAGTYVELYGTEGALRLGWTTSSYRAEPNGPWKDFGSGYEKLTAMGLQVEDFLAAVRDGRPGQIDTEDALASVEVIQAAYASITQRGWLPARTAESRIVPLLDAVQAEGVA
jgi:predicted dehydrogenase